MEKEIKCLREQNRQYFSALFALAMNNNSVGNNTKKREVFLLPALNVFTTE
jgi:hypothetical protein